MRQGLTGAIALAIGFGTAYFGAIPQARGGQITISGLPVPVAVSGMPVPGTASATYSEGFAFGTPISSSNGQVIFVGNLDGGMAVGPTGMFAGSSTSLLTVALEGASTPSGSEYKPFTFSGSVGSIASDGRVAVIAGLNGTSGSPTTGIFTGVPDSLQTSVLQGGAAPGGGTYSNFYWVALNDEGRMAFTAQLQGGPTGLGIFSSLAGVTQALAIEGAAAPTGGNYAFGTPGSTEGVNAPIQNQTGQVAFLSGLTGGSSTSGLFLATPISSSFVVQTLALQGGPAPGTGGGSYQQFTAFNLNNAGQVALAAKISGGTTPGGLFLGTPGSVQPIALMGTAAPGGGIYGTDLTFVAPALNASGQVAFTVNLSTAGPVNDRAVFSGTPGSLQRLARSGGEAPEGGTFEYIGNPVLSNRGTVAFVATLHEELQTFLPPDVEVEEGIIVSGLYASQSNGSLIKIVRIGDQVNVGTGGDTVLRTVDQIDLATTGQAGFLEHNILVYNLHFDNGTSGVFTTVVPVPEPSMIGLASTAALAFAGWRKRRQRFASGS